MIPTVTDSPSGSVSKNKYALPSVTFGHGVLLEQHKVTKQVGDKCWLDSRPRCSIHRQFIGAEMLPVGMLGFYRAQQ